MSFPYQCLATAILPSCPAGPTCICRLTPLPSPHTANTHGGTHFTSSYTLSGRYWLDYAALMHHLRQGKRDLFAVCGAKTSCASFPSYFPSRVPLFFCWKLVCEAFGCSVLVCLHWSSAETTWTGSINQFGGTKQLEFQMLLLCHSWDQSS